MYGYAANATVQWAPGKEHPHSVMDTVHIVVIAAPVAAAVVLVLVIISMATCSAFWARRRNMHKNRTQEPMEHSAVPEDREHLVPRFANAANGDMV